MSGSMKGRLIGVVGIAAGLLAAGTTDSRAPKRLMKPAFVPPVDAPKFAPDRVVVKFTETKSAQEIEALFGTLGGHFLESGVDHAFEVLRVAPGTVESWVATLSKLPGVVYAEPDYICWMSGAPNDTYYNPYQWNFFNWGQLSNGYASNYGVQGDSAWNTNRGASVIVAVVDTGVAYENYGSYVLGPDLSGATFVSPNDYVNVDSHANDDNGHGTHVCGTIRQQTNNNLGLAGLAYECQIMPVKVLDSAGSGYHSWIADGIRWAANNGAFSINLSLGGSTGSSTLSSAVDYAWNQGCVLCAATGNGGKGNLDYPARYANCMAVGATRFDGKRCTYSNYGSGIDVVAPGGDTTVDQNHDGYGDGILQETFSGGYGNFGYYFFEGTSMATPHATATAALVKSNKSWFTNTDVRNAIQTKTKDLGTSGYDTKFGYGLVSAKDALTY